MARDTAHIDVIKGLIKKGYELIGETLELLDTKVIVGNISEPKTSPAPKPKRQYRKKQTPDPLGGSAQ